MAQSLTLKVSVPEQHVTKVIQFDSAVPVFDACTIVRDKITHSNLSQPKDYGLFLPGEEGLGVWFEPGRELRYYFLKNQDLIEYRRKIRQLKVRMLDGTIKTLMVDDSQPVSQMMVVICTKIGIMNHDEYSLVRELEADEGEVRGGMNVGTLTLRRGKKDVDKDSKEKDAKMEKLKTKIRTDDEINWVDQSKTLREQGVHENEVLLLRRKYFFSDGNIDSQDPIQLNLLYVQCRDAILDGTHPVTLEKACEFGGIQCQIQFGEHNEQRHKPGFLSDLREFLPPSYVRSKGVEKRLFVHHRRLSTKSELDSKFEYVSLARSLKTYGVTFFLVKEKLKRRNKLVPRLLGVTKESVLRLDEKTKEILKTWPLTTVRRWAASANTCTLDFGDYSDSYYPFQTTEGEQIAQLIAGYIDIILKKQRPVGHIGIEGDEGLALQEDNVVPMTPNIIQHWDNRDTQHVEEESLSKPGIMRPGVQGPQTFKTGSMQGIQSVAIEGKINEAHQVPTAQSLKVSQVRASRPHQALVSTLDSGQETILTCIGALETKVALPELGTDPASVRWREVTLDSNKQTVTSQIAAMNAATAEVVTLTSSVHDEVDHTAIGTAIHTITSNLPEMTKGVKMIAALLQESGGGSAGERNSSHLLQATKTLCTAFSDLLQAAEPERREPRQNLLGAATRVGDASKGVLTTITDEDSQETQDILLGLAKAVANTTAALILKTKGVANHSQDQVVQNKVINAATTCALATSQLVACAKVVAPTIENAGCQKQVVEATKEVGRAVEGIVQVCQESLQTEGEGEEEGLLRDLSFAAGEVTHALNDLLNYIKGAADRKSGLSAGGAAGGEMSVHEEAVETILISSERLFTSAGNSAEMVRQAKVLAQATSELINSIKTEATSAGDANMQSRLFAAAKALADATSRMVEAAKECAEKPGDKLRQEKLISTADNVRVAAYMAAGGALKKKIVKRLEAAAKHAAAAATQCMAAAQGAGSHNSSVTSHDALITDCKAVADVIPQLVEGVKGTINDTDSPRAQAGLINACNSFLQPGTKMVASVRAALPTVTDPASSMQLSTSSKQFHQALADLRTAMSKAQETCGSLDIEAALDSIQCLEEDLRNLKGSAADGSLRPLPGETPAGAVQGLNNCSKTVGSTMAQLLTAASQAKNGHYAGLASRDTAQALKEFSSCVRGVVATTEDCDLRMRLIDAAREVMVRSLELIQEARVVVESPQSTATSQQKLAQVAKGVSQALHKTVNCLPGQKDVDEAIKGITEYTNDLEEGRFPPPSAKPYGELQTELSHAAAELNDASTEVVSSARVSTQHLATSSRKFSTAFGSLMDVGMEMAGTAKDTEVRGKIVVSLKSVSVTSSKLLVSAKSIAMDPNAPNAKNQLQGAARTVTESINNLIDVCTSSAPGQKECDGAIRAILSMAPLLQSPSEPINDSTYFDCLENVMDRSKALGDGMTGIANHAKKLEHQNFGVAVRAVSKAICGLVESAAQSAYLVGISDRSSVAGRPGLVDQSQFARAYQAILGACQALNGATSTQQEVLSAATVIAKHTSALCNSCRVASAKTSNPVAKRHFVQSAKDVANATAHLVKEIKLLDQDYSPENRARCGGATQPLLESVEALCTFANSAEFTSVPAKISEKALQEQGPITSAGGAIIEGSCAMIEAAKSLAVNPKDPPTWQALACHSKNVSDSIKNLVASIRDKAPGQRECEDALDTLNLNIRDLDQASLAVMHDALQHDNRNTLQGYNEQMEVTLQALLSILERVRESAKGEASLLGHSIHQMDSYFTPLVHAAIGSASNMTNSKRQACLLDECKSVLECALPLVYAAKEGGGNPKNGAAHQEIEECAEGMRESIQELLSTGERLATEAGVVSGLVESITSTINRFSEAGYVTEGGLNGLSGLTGLNQDSEASFAHFQSGLVASAKEIIRIAQEMVSKSTLNSSQLGSLGASLSHEYNQLARHASGATQLAAPPELGDKIRCCVQEIGQSCVDLVKCGGSCQSSPRNTYCQRDLAESARHLGAKVTSLLGLLKASSQGTQACIDAASTVSGIIGDLDTTILFATAGSLNANDEGPYGGEDLPKGDLKGQTGFADHRDHILQTAKALVEDTKTLVAGAASSQEQLACAAQNAVSTIVRLAEVVKSGAASLGSTNQEAQVMLMNAVKDVAMALGDLIQATKSASGRPINDPAISTLKESAKVMVTNVTCLLKTVKTVEDEQMRGTQALEGTIEAVGQEIRAFSSPDPPPKSGAGPPCTPEDLVRATKPLTLASSKAVSAGLSRKQDDVIATANLGRKAVSTMLTTCRSAAWACESPEIRSQVLSAGQETAVQYRSLLQTVLQCVLQKQGHSATEEKVALSTVSRNIAHCVTALVNKAEQLKGTDWEDPEDPTVIAESELLSAANSIEAAARKLQSLRPRRESGGEAKDFDEENMNFEEIILEACKSIAAATGALVKAASRAQRELVEAGKIKSRPLAASDDGQWSEGLVSAARLVAASTHYLCEAANSLVLGQASEEKLIASAKQVAASTAQLLVACKVKADPNSEATKRLQEAGNKVKKATDSLVRAAQQSLQQEEERTLMLSVRPVRGIVEDIKIKENILRLENALHKEREKQAYMNRVKANLSGQSDNEGNLSGYESSHETPSGGLRDDLFTVSYTPSRSPNPSPIHNSRHNYNHSPTTTLHHHNQINNQSTPPTINSYHKSSLFTSINQSPSTYTLQSPRISTTPAYTPTTTPDHPPSTTHNHPPSTAHNHPPSTTHHHSSPFAQSEIVEGPSFKDAMRRFQPRNHVGGDISSTNNSSSSTFNQTSSTNNSSLFNQSSPLNPTSNNSSMYNQTSSFDSHAGESIVRNITTSQKKVERTIKMTSSSRAYHLNDEDA